MRTSVLFSFCFLAATLCRAQAPCDSLYAQEDAFTAGKGGLVWFEKAPEIIGGRGPLVRYNVPKDSVGAVYFRVLIDAQGNPLCLRWLRVTNEALRGTAIALASTLRFTPAVRQGKGIPVSMTLVVRFVEGPPPTKKELRKARPAHVQ
ncbi:hypothetical protein I2I05_19820 [Hymenobacter sp. BT683]|uniref:TonB C-terminal domain-containing protein n=1 Tax=Hymenobacter jeongseonensis TaxID=2791027 RepID=A0ABS0IMV6_9BACT|nr:hypothetical protein [Hymenobacter jeongseonensis]MBF9239651.1 hypothetical protein [Hymenobacter jeongseonensis]